MADETPKKVVEDSSRCFTCPSLSADNNRVFTGKSDHSFADIIKTLLNVDVNCYANSKLFICKNACYNRLLKFQRALEKLEKIKREINEAFRVRPRAKCLLRPADEDLEQDRAPLTARPVYRQQTEPRRRNRCNSAQLKIFLPLVFLLLTVNNHCLLV